MLFKDESVDTSAVIINPECENSYFSAKSVDLAVSGVKAKLRVKIQLIDDE